MHCPSEDYNPDDGRFCNYVGSMGPQCLGNGGCGGPDVTNIYCDPKNNGLGDWGYPASPGDANDYNASNLRGVFGRANSAVKFSMIVDGLSNTLMVGEVLVADNNQITGWGSTGGLNWASWNGGNAQAATIIPINYTLGADVTNGNWCSAAPPQANYWNQASSWGFRSNHTGGANFAFCDGSVRFLSQTVDSKTYNLLGCRNDKQPVQIP